MSSLLKSSATALIECSDQPLDLSFHPTKSSLLAAALVDGTLEVHDAQELLEAKQSKITAKVDLYNSDDDQEDENDIEDDIEDDVDDEIDTIVSSTAVHTQLLPASTKPGSTRAVLFNRDGRHLYTGGSTGDLCVLEAELVSTFASSKNPLVCRIDHASHSKSPIQCLKEILDTNDTNSASLLVTGDEAGCVRLWDTRLLGSIVAKNTTTSSCERLHPACVQSWKVHEDYVSDFSFNNEDGYTLLSTSADGVLSVFDARVTSTSRSDNVINASSNRANLRGLIRQSDPQDDELLSILIMKYNRKVVCGTAEGVLDVWSWNSWGDISDRYPGHAPNIEAMLKVNEDTLLMGASDGYIRVVQVQPNKVLGVLSDNHGGFPIEKMDYNADQTLVGSLTHDNYIRLWDAQILQKDWEPIDTNANETFGMSATTNNFNAQSTSGTNTNLFSVQRESDDEWDDMDEDDDNEDMEDEEEEKDDDDSKTSECSDSDDSGSESGNRPNDLGSRFKTDNEKFFSDL